MAGRTLEDNIKKAIADFDSIETAIEDKGVPVPSGTDTSEYAAKILQIGKVEEQDKTLDVTENGSYTLLPDEGKALSSATVNVNVPERKEEQEKTLEVTKNGSYKVLPDEGKALSGVNVEVDVAFEGDIGKPYIDTSKMTYFYNFFSKNPLLLDDIENIDTSNGTDFSYMFNSCSITSIPPIDTKKGTTFSNMFRYCSKLKEVPTIDLSNATDISSMFYGCSSLETLSLTSAPKLSDTKVLETSQCTSLTNISIGSGWKNGIYVHYSSKITVESLHGMIENLADLTGLTAKTFQVGATNLAKIDEAHMAMLQSKNWNYK